MLHSLYQDGQRYKCRPDGRARRAHCCGKINETRVQERLESVSDDHTVSIMDFSQNLTLPSVTSTPSQWYFLSLFNVNVFGIYYANKAIQCNYAYDESVAGKWTDEVNSMLYYFIQKIVLPGGCRKLTIYADNCGGQNKNNFVLKMLLSLAQMGELDAVQLKCFVKGHTKNTVDRGLGTLEKNREIGRLDNGSIAGSDQRRIY